MIGSKLGIYANQANADANLLLDVYPNQFGESFALHRVRTGFSSDVIELKRDDGTAQRFALDGAELPIAAMSTFVGSGDGKVTWWKGQANGLEVSQTSDGACPLLFQNGVLIEENGKPALKFMGAQWLQNSNILSADGRPIISAVIGSADNNNNPNNTIYWKGKVGSFDNRYGILSQYWFTRQVGVSNESDLQNIGLNYGNVSIIGNQLIDGINHQAYINNQLIESESFPHLIGSNNQVFQIGAADNGFNMSGKIQEVHIWFDSNAVGNRSNINNFINQRYNIY